MWRTTFKKATNSTFLNDNVTHTRLYDDDFESHLNIINNKDDFVPYEKEYRNPFGGAKNGMWCLNKLPKGTKKD